MTNPVWEWHQVSVVDIVVLAVYFALVLLVGLWSSYKSGTDTATMGGFFLAGRDMHWLLIGASLYASNIGSGHFVGLVICQGQGLPQAGSGAAGGIAVAGFELNAAFVLIVLGWLFVPVYYSSGVFTMPEYLRRRFGGRRIQVYLSALALLLYVFTKLSADLFAGAIFLKSAFDLNIFLSITALLIVAMVFTIAGGLTAVIWTDAMQVVIMVIGSFILMIMGFIKVGGYSELMRRYFADPLPHWRENMTTGMENTSDACVASQLPRTDALSLLRPVGADLPWTGMTFGLTVSAVWYWCSDQVIVQRVLAAKTFTHAKAGCAFAGMLKFMPLFTLIIPGMISRVLYDDCLVCYSASDCKDKCGSEAGCSNLAYPLLVIRILPQGLTGLMLACMLSALMSSLTSVFNSSSTIFTIDIWPLFRPKATEIELLIVGRLFVVVLVAVSVLWIPIIQAFPDSQLFNYIQSVTSYLGPPVCAVYVLAVFVPRVNEQGAFWGLMIGLAVGLSRFIAEISYGSIGCDDVDTRPSVVRLHYLHFGLLLFVIVVGATLVVSMLTPPIGAQHLHRLTYWTRWCQSQTLSNKQPLPIEAGDDDNTQQNSTLTSLEKKLNIKEKEKREMRGSAEPAAGTKAKLGACVKSALRRAMGMDRVQPIAFYLPPTKHLLGAHVDEPPVGSVGLHCGQPPRATYKVCIAAQEEVPWQRLLCDLAAVGVMIMAVFTYAFYM